MEQKGMSTFGRSSKSEKKKELDTQARMADWKGKKKKKRERERTQPTSTASSSDGQCLKELYFSPLLLLPEGNTNSISLVALNIKQLSQKVFVCIRERGGVQMDGKRKRKKKSFSFCWRAHIPPRESLSALFLISKEEEEEVALENVRSRGSRRLQSRPSSTALARRVNYRLPIIQQVSKPWENGCRNRGRQSKETQNVLKDRGEKKKDIKERAGPFRRGRGGRKGPPVGQVQRWRQKQQQQQQQRRRRLSHVAKDQIHAVSLVVHLDVEDKLSPLRILRPVFSLLTSFFTISACGGDSERASTRTTTTFTNYYPQEKKRGEKSSFWFDFTCDFFFVFHTIETQSEIVPITKDSWRVKRPTGQSAKRNQWTQIITLKKKNKEFGEFTLGFFL